MKGLLFLFLIISFISNSCKKQELEADHPLVGKWTIDNIDLYKKCSNPVRVTYFPVKLVEIEILNSGEMIFRSGNDEETLRIVKIEKSVEVSKFSNFGNTIRIYNCKVRNRSGKTLSFKFHFKSVDNQMVGTYWTPHHIYCTTERINCGSVQCSVGSTYTSYYDDEVFAIYLKN